MGVVTLFQDFPTATIIWVIWSIVYQQVENNLIQPQIQKRAVDINPFLVVVAVLFGSALLGILGALVAVPVAASIQIAVREYLDYRGIRPRPAEPPEPPPPDPEPPAAAGPSRRRPSRAGGATAKRWRQPRRRSRSPPRRAPARAAVRLSASWRRQLVISATFERRSFTEKARSLRVSSIELRICSGVRLAGMPAIRA